ncbi:hypothetical protein TCON_1018 [Astathelohania contejeani]|uniref:t-SNARE coiled-coil homology domain-containing protein n=1 Tax=Astathelohania contejeani TaxID=164912 RepID=A0ABQ7I074_9MICR|nr:hypothetical protein TCON_1018 [Thelohania contejeani]
MSMSLKDICNTLESYINLLEEKYDAEMMLECSNMIDIALSMIKTHKYNNKELEPFKSLKNRFSKIQERFNVRQNLDITENIIENNNIKCNMLNRNLIEHENIPLLRQDNLRIITNKIEEINEISDYISCLIELQGHDVDNISVRMDNNRITSESTITQFGIWLQRLKRNNKIIGYLLLMFGIIIIVVMLKMILIRIIDNLL